MKGHGFQSVRRLLRAVFIRLAAVGLTLLAAEVVLQGLHGFHGPDDETGRMVHDELLGWRLEPNAVIHYRTSEYETTVRINECGFRSVMPEAVKPDNAFRILVLGDSFAEEAMVNDEHHFCTVLKQHLQQRYPDKQTEVINFGTSGYCTAQELLQFERWAAEIKPDVTVLMFCNNDVWDNTQQLCFTAGVPRPQRPCFVLENDKLSLTNVPVPDVRSPMTGNQVRLTGVAAGKEWLSRRCMLYGLVRRVVKRNHRLHELALKLGIANLPTELAHDPDKLPIPAKVRCWQPEYDEEIAYSWQVTEALLVRLQQSARAHGSDVMVFFTPSLAHISPQKLHQTQSKLSLPEDWRPRRVVDELVRRCRRHGIEVIEPTDSLAQAHKQRRRGAYFKRSEHWNIDGNAVVGRILADHIETRLGTSALSPHLAQGSAN